MPSKNLPEIYLDRLNESTEISEHNKELIKSFFNEKVASGLNPDNIHFYLKVMIRLANKLNKNFEEITKEDLIDYFVNLKPETIVLKNKTGVFKTEINEYSPKTLQLYKSAVKTFWIWLMKGKQCERDEKGFPLSVSWIHASMKVKSKKPQDILSRDEINSMIKLTNNSRDKAIIAVLFESGMRVSELLGMKLNDLKEFEGYAQTKIDGKTGEREVVFLKSWPYLKNWLNWLNENQEIISDEAKPFVWITFPQVGLTKRQYKKSGRKMNKEIIWSMLKRNALKAGITKRVWTHGFRHASATDFAKQGYNETEMRLKYGWSKTSNIPSNYTHYKFDELKDKMLFKAGKKAELTTANADILKTKECPFCSHENPNESEYCGKCSRPLSIQTIKKQEKQIAVQHFQYDLINKLEELKKEGVSIQRINEKINEWIIK